MSTKKIIKSFRSTGIIVLLIFFALSACEKTPEDKPFYDNIASISQYIYEKGDTFSCFRDLITRASLKSTLAAYNPYGNDYTLFLPTNEAFQLYINNNTSYSSFEDLLKDTAFMNILARYHIVNSGIETYDFPYGSLPDTTLSGDLLTIGYSDDYDSTIVLVNSYATIIKANITLGNGYIHVVDRVLEPVVDDSYSWLLNYGKCSIFVDALELTGLKDTFQLSGENKYPSFSLFVETDDVFKRKGIYSVNDLINAYSPYSSDYENYSNGLYQFIAYHILEDKIFLNDFEDANTNYNTCANLPLSVNGIGLDLKINPGVGILDTLIADGDTTFIDYVRLDYDNSNVLTKNGAVHFILDILDITRPDPKERTFQFYEEPMINKAQEESNTYIFNDPGLFEILVWDCEELQYINSSSSLSGVLNNDYLKFEGEFSASYEMSKILPGRYTLQIRCHVGDSGNAFIIVSIDGSNVGDYIDLTTNKSSAAFKAVSIGEVSFDNYEKHTIQIKTLIPGTFLWDAVVFVPVD